MKMDAMLLVSTPSYQIITVLFCVRTLTIRVVSMGIRMMCLPLFEFAVIGIYLIL